MKVQIRYWPCGRNKFALINSSHNENTSDITTKNNKQGGTFLLVQYVSWAAEVLHDAKETVKNAHRDSWSLSFEGSETWWICPLFTRAVFSEYIGGLVAGKETYKFQDADSLSPPLSLMHTLTHLHMEMIHGENANISSMGLNDASRQSLHAASYSKNC